MFGVHFAYKRHIIVHRSGVEIVFATPNVSALVLPSRERVSHAAQDFPVVRPISPVCRPVVRRSRCRLGRRRSRFCASVHCAYNVIGALTVAGEIILHVSPATSVVHFARTRSRRDVGVSGTLAVPSDWRPPVSGTAAAALGVEGYSGHVHRMRVHGRIAADDPEFRRRRFPRFPPVMLITDSGISRSLSSQSLPVHDEPPLRMMNHGLRTPLAVWRQRVFRDLAEFVMGGEFLGWSCRWCFPHTKHHRSQPFHASDSMLVFLIICRRDGNNAV